ncbi:MAG: hypothetical protein M1335_00595 [Chloroflexi bacterium]|nr:hypothetical protein [Chloroflexota bacterium]
MKCLKCGVENNPTNLTCAGCGELFEHGRGSDRTMALQPVDVEEDAGQFETTAFEEPSLIVTKGGDACSDSSW